jgi:peptide/nickel transport system permease protein
MTDVVLTQPKGIDRFLRGFIGNPRAAVGLGLVTLAIVFAVGAPIFAPFAPDQLDFITILAPPSADHWMGTDELGRDVLSRIIYGARTSLVVGALSVVVAALIGTAAGVVAGYFGKTSDALIMRLMDIVFAFPSILLALAIAAVLGPSLTNAVLAISVVNLPVFARIARAQTLVVRQMEFVEAKRALGFGTFNILSRTILPNIMAPIIVHGILPLVPWPWCATAYGHVGQYAPECHRIYGARSLACLVSRLRYLHYCFWLQPPRRWVARQI